MTALDATLADVLVDHVESSRHVYLPELEADTHLHVHRENTLLFSSVPDLQRALAAR